jgi:hypothetical protein
MHHLADDKLRVIYRENPILFVMDRKQPRIYVAEAK